MRVIVFGLAKSGTTALYASLQRAMGDATSLVFEPWQIEVPKTEDALVKTHFLQNPNLSLGNNLNHFDKKILIVRDPRDILVSSFLFYTGNARFVRKERKLNMFLRELRKKEKDPNCISLISLLEKRDELEEIEVKSHHRFKSFKQILGSVLRKLSQKAYQMGFTTIETRNEIIDAKIRETVWQRHWDQRHDLKESYYDKPIHFAQQVQDLGVLRYEDFVDGKLGAVSEYLGFELTNEARLRKYQHLERTKTYGNWKDWILPEDIPTLKGVFGRYIEYFGYDDDWEINDKQTINPKYSSEYITKLAAQFGGRFSINWKKSG